MNRDAGTLTRAVQYLRMSTEHQRYSLENQGAAIADYALARGYQIRRTYTDEGKSGLHLKGRRGLQELLSDTLHPDRDFDVILVLDVSRWGRFQDPDQSAYYEYMCRQAGVRIAYVGEQFENDGGMVSNIVKHLKRVMAAEYSREVSAKVTRAKLQQARLGFRQGGSVSYGFRRELVTADGAARCVLGAGQYKGLNSDRVRTVAGPPEEQEVIRRIFRLFVRPAGTFRGVAQRLNADGVPTGSGRPWTAARVRYIIRNPLCIGIYTYNRTNRLMRQATVRRPDADWIRVRVAPAIVSPALYRKANRLAGGERHRYSEPVLLRGLKRLLRRKGYLTSTLIDDAADMPTSMTYVLRFGSMARAYEMIGYQRNGRMKYIAAVKGYWTNEAILNAVRELWERTGRVSGKLLSETPNMPSPNLIHSRFGGLVPCYEAAGIPLTEAQAFWKKRLAAGVPMRPPLVPEGLVLGPVAQALLREREETSSPPVRRKVIDDVGD